MARVGLLQELPLREGFPGEATDFTPWLAEDANLAYLGARIGLGEMNSVGIEVAVTGGRSLDILAETPDGRNVAIENQYGVADHDHLTRGLAYAVATDASALVVVAEDHRDEFIAVADYLNRVAEQASEDGIGVFLVKARLLKGNEGVYADFDVLTGPNEWRRDVSASVNEAEATKLAHQAEFWNRAMPVIRRATGHFAGSAVPKKVNFISMTAVTGTGTQYLIVVNQKRSYCKLELRDDKETNERIFDLMQGQKSAIESRFGAELSWDRADGAIGSFVTTEGLDFGVATDATEEQIVQLAEEFQRFRDALQPSLSDALISID